MLHLKGNILNNSLIRNLVSTISMVSPNILLSPAHPEVTLTRAPDRTVRIRLIRLTTKLSFSSMIACSVVFKFGVIRDELRGASFYGILVMQ